MRFYCEINKTVNEFLFDDFYTDLNMGLIRYGKNDQTEVITRMKVYKNDQTEVIIRMKVYT